MRTFGLLIACMCVSAASAFAFSGQLSVGACPGDPAVGAPNLDCASGESFTLNAVFEPSHDIPDLIGLDAVMDFTLLSSTLADSPFWNFDPDQSPCANTLGMNRLRPVRGCVDYRQLWNETGSVSGYAATQQNPYVVRVGATCYRASSVAAAQNEQLFGFQLLIDMSNSSEAGGTCAGCGAVVRLDWVGAGAYSASSQYDDIYSSFCYHGLCPPPITTLTLNDRPVPVQKHSWGQLKSLYR
jgi:hypothetical protein